MNQHRFEVCNGPTILASTLFAEHAAAVAAVSGTSCAIRDKASQRWLWSNEHDGPPHDRYRAAAVMHTRLDAIVDEGGAA